MIEARSATTAASGTTMQLLEDIKEKLMKKKLSLEVVGRVVRISKAI
ncbi:MAG: hypothetical protein ABH874_06110 [Methanobacteriota archaeon]